MFESYIYFLKNNEDKTPDIITGYEEIQEYVFRSSYIDSYKLCLGPSYAGCSLEYLYGSIR